MQLKFQLVETGKAPRLQRYTVLVKYCCLPGKGVQCLGLLVPVVLLIGVPVRLGLIDPAHGVLIHIKVAPDNLVFFVFGIRPDNDYGSRIFGKTCRQCSGRPHIRSFSY